MTPKNRLAASPTALDAHIGQRLRMQRELANLTQDALGKRIGISGQQIQKYETGDNRIGAARLHEISLVLGVPLDFFFAGLRTEQHLTGERLSSAAAAFAKSPEGIRLIEAYISIQEPGVRLKFIELFEQMTNPRTVS